MAIRFVIDSAADIMPDEAAQLGLIHVPLTVRFEDGSEYRDSVDLSHIEFYDKLASSKELPVTSQVPPVSFENAIRPLVEAGDSVVIFTLSSALSGTYQSACIAADNVGGDVYVVDTENVSPGQRILVQRAMQLRDMGMDAQTIKETIDAEKKKVRLIAALDTLENLKKGGRISSAVAFAGTLLGIKPVIGIVDGKVEMIGKARGSKNVNNLLRQLVEKIGGIDFSRPVCVAYSGKDDTLMKRYIEDSKDLYTDKIDTLATAAIGSVIGTHAGAGAVAVAFFSNN